MTDSIEEIRARHADAELIEYDPPRQMHDDRAILLAEVDRQREENEKLRAELRWALKELAAAQQLSAAMLRAAR